MNLGELMRFAGLFFAREKIDYFVLGATAMNFWIPPRNTVDLDVLIRADKRRARRILHELKKRKFPITAALTRKFLEGRFIKVPIGTTELDLKLCANTHERKALERAKGFRAEDYDLRIATPEDIILSKLQFWRLQDQADIQRMLKQRTDLDLVYIEKWLDLMEEQTGAPLRARWNAIRYA